MPEVALLRLTGQVPAEVVHRKSATLPELTGETLADVVRRKGATAGRFT